MLCLIIIIILLLYLICSGKRENMCRDYKTKKECSSKYPCVWDNYCYNIND